MTEEAGRAVAESTRAELESAVRRKRAAARRHGLWALLGISPAAAIPLLGTTAEFGVAGLLAIGAAVFAIEGWRSIRANRAANELEREMGDLDAEIRALSPPPPHAGD